MGRRPPQNVLGAQAGLGIGRPLSEGASWHLPAAPLGRAQAAGPGPQQPPAAGMGLLWPFPEPSLPQTERGWIRDDLTSLGGSVLPPLMDRGYGSPLPALGLPLSGVMGGEDQAAHSGNSVHTWSRSLGWVRHADQEAGVPAWVVQGSGARSRARRGEPLSPCSVPSPPLRGPSPSPTIRPLP